MDKGKKGLILKTWERCKSIGRGGKGLNSSSSSSTPPAGIKRFLMRKTKSWPRIKVEELYDDDKEIKGGKKKRVAPEGCFTVYVGQEKQRFVIKTEYANHPLFRMLLEEAEAEYGYNSQAPLSLPCNVDMFYRVMMEMDDGYSDVLRGCVHPKRFGSYHLLSPSRAVVR